MSSWYLEHVTTRDKIILHKGDNVMGRHSRCRIVMKASYEYVSREHVNMIVDGDKVVVQSMNALNGVYINQGRLSNKIKCLEVLEGSVISLGVEGPAIDVPANHAMFILRKIAPLEEAVVLSSDDDDTNPLPPLKTPLGAKDPIEFNLEKQLNGSGNIQDKIKKDVPAPCANLHLPKLPEVKQELMKQTSEEITNIFGEPNEAILGGVLNINPYIYNTLSAQSGASMSTAKKMHDGDSIELDSVEENGEMLPPAVPAQKNKAHEEFDERFEFSQAVLQEIKDEMDFCDGEEDFLETNGLDYGDPESPSSQLGEGEIILSDDEDYDVSSWSDKLHSQKPADDFPMSQAYPMMGDAGSDNESEMQVKIPPKPLCIDTSSSEDEDPSGSLRKADSTSFIRQCYVRLQPVAQPEISSTVEEPQLFSRRTKKASKTEEKSHERLFQRRPALKEANKKSNDSDIEIILDSEDLLEKEPLIPDQPSSTNVGMAKDSEKPKIRSRSKSVACREDLDADTPTTSKKLMPEKLSIPNLEAEKSSEKSKMRTRTKSVACREDLDAETPTSSKKLVPERPSISSIEAENSSEKSNIRKRKKSVACREDLEAETPTTSKKSSVPGGLHKPVEKSMRLRNRSKSCYVEEPIELDIPEEELEPVEAPVEVTESKTSSSTKTSSIKQRRKSICDQENDKQKSNNVLAKESKEAPKPAESLPKPRISPRLQNRAKSCYVEFEALPPASSDLAKKETKKSSPAKTDASARVSDFKENRMNRGPSVIEPPALPQHRGKLRGVSVEVNGQDKQKQYVLAKQKLIEDAKQMNAKWKQKPKDKKKEDKEIKDRRREVLKKIAEKPKEQEKSSGEKRKHATTVPTVNNSNRGEFLTKEVEGPPPKVPKKDNAKKDQMPAPKKPLPPRRSTIESFSQQLLAADDATINQPKRGARPAERREAEAARNQRTCNRVTFAEMERQRQWQEDLKKKSKRVRFDDNVKIIYIEKISGVSKFRGSKESNKLILSTYKERREWTLNAGKATNDIRHHSRTILKWGNQWLKHRSVDAVAETDVLIPIPQDFENFKQYRNIIIPLMKLELLSTIERDYKSSNTTFEVGVVSVYSEDNCYRLITRVNSRPIGKFILYTLKSGSELPETFGNLQDQKCIGGNAYNMTFDILMQDISLETMNKIKRITVRPVIDSLRIELGAMSAVHQLYRSPLCGRIMRPAKAAMPFRLPKTGQAFNYKGYHKLNEHQEDVILKTYQRVIDDANPSLTLIQGPPGTGKSAVISNISLQCLYGNAANKLDRKILICAHSNTAIDRIVNTLYSVHRLMSKMQFELLRFGLFEKMSDTSRFFSLEARYQMVKDQKLKRLSPENLAVLQKQYAVLKSDILKLKEKENLTTTYLQQQLQQKEKQLQLISEQIHPGLTQREEFDIAKSCLSRANIVCTTLSSCVKLANYIDFFDICIIDEATQCTEPWTLLPMRFGLRHLVLVGDTQQLPAVVLSQKAIEYGLSNSMFDRIQRSLQKQLESPGSNQFIHTKLFKLSVQYRMHPEICRWPNKYFYEDQLVSAPCTEKSAALIPYSVINLSYTRDSSTMSNKSISNDEEARFVAKLITAMQKLMPTKRYSYGLISPYSNQCYALSQVMTEDMKVTPLTIDAYQGLEKDVIIISNARTRGCGFLSNYHRLNVALTRPKRCLVICGNFDDIQVS
ncbi:hypothetical protein KR067_003106 [Drosophila pandora]|nr:hypothetical protein KR067_003106 [Drosophila pandora]